MKRSLVIVTTTFLIIISIAIMSLVAIERWHISPFRQPNYNDCDEEMLTKHALTDISYSLLRFSRLASKTDKEAIRKVRNLTEMWSLLEKKNDIDGPLAPSPEAEDYSSYMKDGWKNPYILGIKLGEKTTAIRITSNPPVGKSLYVETMINEHGGQTKRSWEHSD